jgi:hypothetical protein
MSTSAIHCSSVPRTANKDWIDGALCGIGRLAERATRSMFDGIHLIDRINVRGAPIKVLDKPYQD